MRTILVVNSKGGCGKSTIATNLACYYALRGLKTALVELDFQRSSLEWLAQRPDGRAPILGIDGTAQRVRYPAGTQRAVLDSPAHIRGRQVTDLVRRADRVLVPVLPSPLDIRAAAHFIGDLLLSGAVRLRDRRLAVIANRVRENTLIYVSLQKFLRRLEIPFVATLRDSQVYIRAAAKGLGIFELPPSTVQRDFEQWRPLIRWLERR